MMIKRSGKILLCIALLLMQMDGVFGYRQAFAATAVAPKLVAGYYHTVSLVSSGEVYSWGMETGAAGRRQLEYPDRSGHGEEFEPCH